MPLLRWLLLWNLALGSSMATARSVYLNGAKIDGATNLKFEKCTVTIDQYGDVHIDAPGYEVEGQGAIAPTQPPAQPADAAPSQSIQKRYWLVKNENYPGKTQYDIDIYINSVWYKRLRSDGEQLVKEITSKLRPGPNVIHFAAVKNVGQQRKSFSPQVVMSVIIGEGNIGGNNVMIENPLVQYKRTANETANFNDEFTIVTR